MNELLIKYQSLDTLLQKQVLDFIDYLVSVKKTVKPKEMSNYKKKILNVSTWSEEDINVFNENTKHFKQWNITEF